MVKRYSLDVFTVFESGVAGGCPAKQVAEVNYGSEIYEEVV